MKARELNFDGLVGPTHNYAGLSWGNFASMKHKSSVSNPRQAALEGLAKMKLLHDLGVPQAVFPPQLRPDMELLRSRGFEGTDGQILEKVHRADPALLAAASSASAMWAANAATVSPSADCADGKVHFTPANLISNLHRSIETKATTRMLRAIFRDESHFIVHDPLPSTPDMSDEGAANHTRLCEEYGQVGLEIFTYGRPGSELPRRYPARQALAASQAIARQHQLDPSKILFIQQDPAAIDAGAFHYDVVAVGNKSVLLCHQRSSIATIAFDGMIEIPKSRVSLKTAIATYLFNSQLVSLPDGAMSLIAPIECRNDPRVYDFLLDLLSRGTPIQSVRYVDVRQSMRNGGGPACLRLRVVLTDAELASIHGNVIFTNALHVQLKPWIEKHYRDELRPDDLRDPKLLEESRAALAELSTILRLDLL